MRSCLTLRCHDFVSLLLISASSETTSHGRNVRKAACISVGVGLVDDRWIGNFRNGVSYCGTFCVLPQWDNVRIPHEGAENGWPLDRFKIHPSSSLCVHPTWVHAPTLVTSCRFSISTAHLWKDLIRWRIVSKLRNVTTVQAEHQNRRKGRSEGIWTWLFNKLLSQWYFHHATTINRAHKQCSGKNCPVSSSCVEAKDLRPVYSQVSGHGVTVQTGCRP